MEHLLPHETEHALVRLGRRGDGGYVVADLPGKYDAFVSAGIGCDASFESAVLRRQPGLCCTAFDGTVDALPPDAHAAMRFVRKNVGSVDDEDTTTLLDTLRECTDAMLKLDVEGHEFRCLPCLCDELRRVKQLVIEWHSPGDIQKHPDYFRGLGDVTHAAMWALLERIAATHTLVHLHPNNSCDTHLVDGCVLPDVFECTYVRSDLVRSAPRPNRQPLPTPLDEPNDAARPVRVFDGPPFVAPVCTDDRPCGTCALCLEGEDDEG